MNDCWREARPCSWPGRCCSSGVILILAYRRASLAVELLRAGTSARCATGRSATAPLWWKIAVSVPFALLLLLNIRPLRLRLVTRPFLRSYRRLLPSMSATEREALDAGTVWWDGELFTGGPDWQKLMSAKVPALTPAEQAFLDGPCEDLCAMLDDWDITHRRADLPPEVWSFIKSQGFFAMIIPRRYGGLEFSAYAHSCVLIKIASRSATASSTIAVPNSLGPAELLLHYGTEAQKNHYLPRLARGEEVPCFALTGPRAGSDAASIPDTGVICKGQWQGSEIVGIRLNFSKRYITLAPIATVVGLAFRLFDPDRLMGDQRRPRHHLRADSARYARASRIGRRHFPLEHPVPERADPGTRCVRAHGRHHRRLQHGRPGLAHAGRAIVGGPLHFAALERHRRRAGGRLCLGGLRAHPPPVQHAHRPLRGHRAGPGAHGGAHLHHGCRALGHRRRHRRRRKAVGAVRHAEISRHRIRPHDRQRCHGRARRQGHLPGAEQLSGPRLPDRAGRDHGRGREYPDAQPDHFRPGSGALPSLRAEGNERGAQSGPRSRGRASSTARSWATSDSRFPMPRARWSWHSRWRASPRCRRPGRPRATSST